MYTNYSRNTTMPTYKRMSHIPVCLPPISKGVDGYVSGPCVQRNMMYPIQPGGKYLIAGLRSGNPNTVSTWKNNPIYQTF